MTSEKACRISQLDRPHGETMDGWALEARAEAFEGRFRTGRLLR
jgi:hypothetical protein